MLGLRQVSKRLSSSLHRCAYSSQSLPADVRATVGVPEVGDRTVYIFAPARTAGQQGVALTVEGGSPAWKVAFANEGKWINPLIGWTSTADALENVARPMYFDSKEAAIEFAKRNGWKYEVEDYVAKDRSRPKRFQGYGDNYSVKRGGVPEGGLRSLQGEAAAGGKKK